MILKILRIFIFVLLTWFTLPALAVQWACEDYLVRTPDGHSIGIVRVESVNGLNYRIIDVSDHLSEYHAHSDPRLRVIDLGTMFSRGVPFLGFGKPNVFAAIPGMNDKGLGYNKVDAKFFGRAETKFVETGDKVQSGLMLVFPELDEEAKKAFAESAKRFIGSRGITCVNINCKVMNEAGFRVGGETMDYYKRPITIFNDILRYGLEWQGKPVKFDIVKTTPGYTENLIFDINWAAYTTPCRLATRACRDFADDVNKSTFLVKINDGLKDRFGFGILPQKPTGLITREVWEPAITRMVVPKALEREYPLGVSEPTELGLLGRILWGPHALFELPLDSARVNFYLPGKLKAYPDANPSVITRAKHAFFSDKRVDFLHRQMQNQMKFFDGMIQNHLFDMLRTHSEEFPNKYNFVVLGDKLVIMKNDIQVASVDWLMAKHILISGNSKDVRFAGEVWKTADGMIHLNSNSGTYQPTREMLEAVLKLFQEYFPGVPVIIHHKDEL